MSRECTIEEVRHEFLEHISALRNYWLKQRDMTERERLNGFIHSILCIFDGCSSALPSFDIAVRPHPEDKQFNIENGDNYYPDGAVINECHLHDLWNEYR